MWVQTTILASLIAASPSEPVRAVWLADGFAGEDLALLSRAAARSTGLELIDRKAAARELTRLSATLGPDPTVGVQSSLRQARDAFLQLDLRGALDAYEAARDASLANTRRVADPKMVARIYFERALISLAGQRKKAARRDLLVALSLDPSLSPDRDEYGPPVFRALEGAKRRHARSRRFELRIDRAPSDAVVRLDGVFVEPGAKITVRGKGPHLLTAEARGHQPRSSMIELKASGERIAVVLERGSGALLASQTLTEWQKLGAGALAPSVVDAQFAVVVARCLSLPFVLAAKQGAGGEIDLTLLQASDGAIARSVRGRRVDWEPWPYASLTESLEGRVLEPPAESVELTMTVSAPSEVEPSVAIPLQVDVRDPGQKLAALMARCGDQTVRRSITSGDGQTMIIDAPAEETVVDCVVYGLDASGATIVQAPPTGAPLRVAVAEIAGPAWYSRWYLWGAIGVALAAGAVATAVVVQPEPETQEVLRIRGPN